MAEGRHFRYTDKASIQQRVLVIQPRGAGVTTVYVPPIGGALPYTVDFDDFYEACLFAASAQLETEFSGQVVLYTRDSDPWWLENLTPVADA